MSESHQIIVIGRSFGAGGRAIGKIISEKLSIPYFDNELIMETARQFGVSSHLLRATDEKRPSFFKRFLTQSYGVQEAYGHEAFTSETIYEAQSKVIKSIAAKGPCVIVGRTADYILRDQPLLTSVFLHAPVEFRAKKIVARGDAPSVEEAIDLAKRRDRDREAYYNYFTGRSWGLASNYTLSLDSSQLDTSNIADIIIAYSNALQKISGKI